MLSNGGVVNWSLVFSVVLSAAYIAWPLFFIVSIMVAASPGAAASGVMRQYIVFLYYPVLLSILTIFLPWKHLNLPPLYHIVGSLALVTVVLWWSGLFQLWNPIKEQQKIYGEVVVYHGFSEGAGSGSSADIKLPDGRVETIVFDHTFPYHNLMKKGFKIPLSKGYTVDGKISVRRLPDLIEENSRAQQN